MNCHAEAFAKKAVARKFNHNDILALRKSEDCNGELSLSMFLCAELKKWFAPGLRRGDVPRNRIC